MTTGEKIKHLRKELGLTADELGAMIGKDRSTIYRYENGDIGSAPVDVIPHLAKALKTTPQHLMGWDRLPPKQWIEPSSYDVLLERAERWFNFTGGYVWTEEEVDVFVELARYIMRIKDRKTYKRDLEFLVSFYKRLK